MILFRCVLNAALFYKAVRDGVSLGDGVWGELAAQFKAKSEHV